MTWHCSGATNQEMISKLKEAGIITTDTAEAAMLAIDRGKYCHEPDPYLDRPRKIGYNVTISAPHMICGRIGLSGALIGSLTVLPVIMGHAHAYALSILTDQLKEGCRALDVGSGSGYLTACMAWMVGSSGKVVGVEHIPELVEIGMRNVREDCPEFIQDERLKFVEADGRAGYPQDAPYNAIHVGAAADTIPEELTKQLAPGGRMIIPIVAIGGFQRFQDLVQVDKNADGSIRTQKLMHVSYVPLTDPTKQLQN